MKYDNSIKALNKAAYDALRACNDTTELPYVDRHSLRLICAETDRLVDHGEKSGEFPSRIREALS